MKILVISTSSRHGSGIVSFNLKEQLEKLGHDAYILSRYNDEDTKVIAPGISQKSNIFAKLSRKLKKIIQNKNPQYHFFDDKEYKETGIGKKVLQLIPDNIDLVIVSFYHQFLNFKSFQQIYEHYKVPVVFWMMDMAAFTGGCHYSWDCEGYKNECGNCPALYSRRKNDLSYKNLLFKKSVLKDMNASAIAISAYQQKQAMNSVLFSDIPVHLMYHSIDMEYYKPTKNKKLLRNQLNIPEDNVLFFAASDIEEYRKGFLQFYEALKKIDNDNVFNDAITVIVTGSYKKNYGKELRNIKILQTGDLKDRKKIINYYCASSYTVVPTLMDSGPLIVMESLACGTPVITYNMGVGDDVIENRKIGFIGDTGDVNMLTQNILTALKIDNKKYNEMCVNARKTALKYFSKEKQIHTLENILKSI